MHIAKLSEYKTDALPISRGALKENSTKLREHERSEYTVLTYTTSTQKKKHLKYGLHMTHTPES